MLGKISKFVQLWQNMGTRYVWFRGNYELKKRTGLLRNSFPVDPKVEHLCDLEEWRKNAAPFYFSSKEQMNTVPVPEEEKRQLQEITTRIKNGEFPYFNSTWFKNEGWMHNPDTGFTYQGDLHWTLINDFDSKAGDIKYVWEKSRFSWVYYFLRDELASGADHAAFIFSTIDDWIANNRINCGPNYKCSQEMSLRLINWTYVLYFYRNSPELTGERFERIMHHMNWQYHHVATNINFSRIAVRNNHAITETLALYLLGKLFPFFKEAPYYTNKGKKWFEEEIQYQVYPDGTYLQFSMNYHRVVVQLMTLAIRFASIQKDKFSEGVYDRATKSLEFLYNCMDEITGRLPNYGANDGALFFPFSEATYRDYRPQLSALAAVLGLRLENVEDPGDLAWLGLKAGETRTILKRKYGMATYPEGGYYTYRDEDSFTFIRCGVHKDRPSQADNLHLDLSVDGKNYLLDAGSYKYNTDEKDILYFNGTVAHNTVMIKDHHQMQKGPRFIWYDWSQAVCAEWDNIADKPLFRGKIKAFAELGDVYHLREVTMTGKYTWKIKDVIEGYDEGPFYQLWHIPTSLSDEIRFVSSGEISYEKGWSSSLYGKKEETVQVRITSNKPLIETTISVVSVN